MENRREIQAEIREIISQRTQFFEHERALESVVDLSLLLLSRRPRLACFRLNERHADIDTRERSKSDIEHLVEVLLLLRYLQDVIRLIVEQEIIDDRHVVLV